jgi:hypothetical protein
MQKSKFLFLFLFLFLSSNIFARTYDTTDSISMEHEYFYRLVDRAASIAPSKYFTDNFKPYSVRETKVILSNDKFMKELFIIDEDIAKIAEKAKPYYTFKRTDKGYHFNPLQEVELRFNYSDKENTKFYNSFGANYKDTNYDLFLSAKGGLRLKDYVLFSYTLSIENNEEDSAELSLYRFNIKTAFKHMAISFSRDDLVMGPGYFGNLLHSNNIDPEITAMIKTEIPYDWGILGTFSAYMWHRWIDVDERENEYPKVWGMRLSLKPTDWIEIAGSRVIFYGGDGNPSYSTLEDYWNLFTAKYENSGGKYDTDQYVGADLSIYLPILKKTGFLKGGKLYTEYSWTDVTAPWQPEDDGKSFQLLGTSSLFGLFLTTGVTDLRFEYSKISDVNYNNHIFGQDGYSDEGYLMGHFAGRDSESFYSEIYHEFTDDIHGYLGGKFIERGLNMDEQQKVKIGYLGAKYFYNKKFVFDLKGTYVNEDKKDLNSSPVYYDFSDESRDYYQLFFKITYLH